MVRDFRELRVWQRAMDLVLLVYRLVRLLPPEERYELGRQLRRAGVSVPANIAEGNGRLHVREYIHHVYIARGSLMEVLTGLEIARRLGYVEDSTVRPAFESIDHVGRMLTRLARQLRAREAESRVPSPEGRVPSPEGRVPMTDDRCPSPDARVPMPESRCPIPDARVPIHP